MDEPIVFRTEKLSVGYRQKALIDGIDISLRPGQILTLIGPNGAGKSTILKTITGQIPAIGGKVWLQDRLLWDWPRNALAKKLAVVLTERVQPEMMSCFEVAAMGRYPHTGRFGALSARDKQIVWDALRRVRAQDIADRDFTLISDGQKQRVLLARALCQEPEVLVLDEPTSFLDIRHKIELLDILLEEARERRMTIILSLHEIDLAEKISDLVLCVQAAKADVPKEPGQVFSDENIAALYGLTRGSYPVSRGSVELERPEGQMRVFVLGGAGSALMHYRQLQRRRIPFAAGILYENDLEYAVAKALAGEVVSEKAFCPIRQETKIRAEQLMLACGTLLDCGAPKGEFNAVNQSLLDTAKRCGLNIVHSVGEIA